MLTKILVIADLKGLAGADAAEKFIRDKIGAHLRGINSLLPDRTLSLKLILSAKKVEFSGIVYFGNKAADIDALLKVRICGGLAVALNSGKELLNAAPVALITDNAWPIALVVAIFAKWGLRAVFQAVIFSECPRDIQHLMLPRKWEEEITAGLAESNFSFHWTICPVGFERAEEMIGNKAIE